jgi:hypothetical protein
VNVSEFAAKQRLKVQREDSSVVINGKSGQLYEYSDTELGIMFITPATKAPRTHMWRKMSSACVAAGMVQRQIGEAEGCLSFDPANQEQVKLALKLAGVKRKRQVAPEQLARLATVGFKIRNATVESTKTV